MKKHEETAANETSTMSIYRHFNGGYYVVQSLATIESTGEKVVIYQSLQNGRVWVRPVSVFHEPVPKGKENPTGQKYRFERVTNFDNQLNLIPTETLVNELLGRNDCPPELKLLNPENVWRTEYLIGRYKNVYVDQNTSYEDFFFDACKPTLPEAIAKRDSMGDPRLSILLRAYIKQDF